MITTNPNIPSLLRKDLPNAPDDLEEKFKKTQEMQARMKDVMELMDLLREISPKEREGLNLLKETISRVLADIKQKPNLSDREKLKAMELMTINLLQASTEAMSKLSQKMEVVNQKLIGALERGDPPELISKILAEQASVSTQLRDVKIIVISLKMLQQDISVQ